MTSKESEKSKWDNVWQKKHVSYHGLLQQVDSHKRTVIIKKYFTKTDKILEAGCGDGKFVFYFHSRGYNLKGIDYVRSVIQKNKEIARREGVKEDVFEVADVRKLAKYKEEFDVYLSMGVIEHFKEREQQLIIKNARLSLKNRGRVVVSVPNLYSPWAIVRPVLSFFSKSMPYQKNISVFKIKEIFEKEGFETIDVFNAEVGVAIRKACRMDQRRFKGIPNPTYYIGQVFSKLTVRTIRGFPNPLYCVDCIFSWLAVLLEKLMPIIGYNTYYVGRKPD